MGKTIKQNKVLTSENLPMFLVNGSKVLSNKDYEFVKDEPVVAGKSVVVNKVGRIYLYMADDHRRQPSQQIIVKEIGSYEMCFLDMESKRSIRLLNYAHA